MITLKKYKELETEVLAEGVKSNFGRTVTPLKNEYLEDLFDKKVIAIEKAIKNLDKSFNSIELEGMYHSHNNFKFSMGKHYDLNIRPRNEIVTINFFDKKNPIRGFFYDIEKQLLFPVSITDDIRNSSYKHQYKFLDTLRYSLESDITQKLKESKIADKLLKHHDDLILLSMFLHKNYEPTFKPTKFMNYSFKLDNMAECIEIECLNNDFINPNTLKLTNSLKNK